MKLWKRAGVAFAIATIVLAPTAMASGNGGENRPPEGCEKWEDFGEDSYSFTAPYSGWFTFKGGSDSSPNGYRLTVYLQEGNTWSVPQGGASISHVVGCPETPPETSTTYVTTTVTVPPSTTSTTPPVTDPPTTTTTTTTEQPTSTTTTLTETTTTIPTSTSSSTVPPPETTTSTTGSRPTVTTTTEAVPVTELPYTGVSLGRVAVLGALLLSLGTAILAAAKVHRRVRGGQ